MMTTSTQSKANRALRSRPMRILLATASAALVLLAGAAPVQASHGGDANSGPPDNTTHYLERFNLTRAASGATTHGLGQLDRSVMDATYADGPETDVLIYDAYYGRTGSWQGIAGRTNCQEDEWWWDGDCDVYRLRYNLSYAASYGVDSWRSLACHELGHTAGLGHRSAPSDTDNNSCMRNKISSDRPRFDAHDISAINATF
jgi:hypothetical protein